MYMTPGTGGPIPTNNQHNLPIAKSPRKMRGLGDALAWVFRIFGVEFTVKKITKGKDCGCSARQAALNKAVPFSRKEQE